jgi:hypothetical protein
MTLSLIMALSVLAVILGLVAGILNGRFFIFLPQNHVACLAIGGNTFVSYLMHSIDRDATKELLKKMKVDTKLSPGIQADAEKELEKVDPESKKCIVTCRDEGMNLILRFLVSLINMHFTSWNPFVKVRPVDVIHTHKKKPGELGGLFDIVRPDPKQEDFLMLSWPRIMVIENVELLNQAVVTVKFQNTKMRVWNLDLIYWTFGGRVSEEADNAISAAFINLLGSYALNEVTDIFDDKGVKINDTVRKSFQQEDFSGRPDNHFNDAMKIRGIEACGVYPQGPFSLNDWNYGSEMKAVADANRANEAAKALADAEVTKAEGTATATIKTGTAEAEIIRLKSEAEAAGALKMGMAFKDMSPHAAAALAQVQSAQALGNPKNNIRVVSLGGQAIPVVYNDPTTEEVKK